MRFHGLLFLMFSLCLAFQCYAVQTNQQQGFSAEFTLPSKQRPLNKKFAIELSLKYPENYELDEDLLLDNLLQGVNLLANHFDLVEVETEKPKSIGSHQLAQKVHFWLEPLVPGNYLLNFFLIPFKPREETEQRVNLVGSIYPLEVLPAAPTINDQELISQDLLPFSQYPLLTVAQENRMKANDLPELNLQALKNKQLPSTWKLALGAIIIVMLLNVRHIKTFIILMMDRWKTMRDPKETALQALEKLNREKNSSKAGTQDIYWNQYYISLSEILRDFIQQKFQLPIKHVTTSEFLEVISKESKFNNLHRMLLAEFFKNADLVKFAQYQVNTRDCETAGIAARQFIESNG